MSGVREAPVVSNKEMNRLGEKEGVVLFADAAQAAIKPWLNEGEMSDAKGGKAIVSPNDS